MILWGKTPVLVRTLPRTEPRTNPTCIHVHEFLVTHRLKNCQFTELHMVSTSKPHNSGILSVTKPACVSTTGPSCSRRQVYLTGYRPPNGYLFSVQIEMWILSISALTTHANNNVWSVVWASWPWSTWHIRVTLPMPAFLRKALRDVGMTPKQMSLAGLHCCTVPDIPTQLNGDPRSGERSESRYRIERQRKPWSVQESLWAWLRYPPRHWSPQ